jgi:hypothetical protein
MTMKVEKQQFIIRNAENDFFEIQHIRTGKEDEIRDDEFLVRRLTGDGNQHTIPYQYEGFRNWWSITVSKEEIKKPQELVQWLKATNFRQFEKVNLTRKSWTELFLNDLVIDNIIGAAYLKDSFPFDEFYFECKILKLQKEERFSPNNSKDFYQCSYSKNEKRNFFSFSSNINAEKHGTRVLGKIIAKEIKEIDRAVRFLEILKESNPDLIKNLENLNDNKVYEKLAKKYGDLLYQIIKTYKILLVLKPSFKNLNHDELHYRAYKRLPLGAVKEMDLKDLGDRFRKLFSN